MEPYDYHAPVLADETVGLMVTGPGVYIDGTLGGGGHSLLILERLAGMPDKGGTSLLVGIDQDSHALAAAAVKLAPYRGAYQLVRGNFSTVGQVARDVQRSHAAGGKVMGILFDLGVSSFQIDTPERGFSYLRNGPLDMRMDPDGPISAKDIVNGYDADALARLFREYGEEPFAGRIARAIVAARADGPVGTTGMLSSVVRSACPNHAVAVKTLSRVYQALRIAVNDELGVLQRALEDGFEELASGGRLAVISYHSLEDRMVKRFFAKVTEENWGPKGLALREPLEPAKARKVTGKAVQATQEEVDRNPRSRSARLRVIQKL